MSSERVLIGNKKVEAFQDRFSSPTSSISWYYKKGNGPIGCDHGHPLGRDGIYSKASLYFNEKGMRTKIGMMYSAGRGCSKINFWIFKS